MLDVLRAGKRYGSVLVITDEEENREVAVDWDDNGEVPSGARAVRRNAYFADVFAQYARTVAPGVQPTFVSFLSNVDRPGDMTPALERAASACRCSSCTASGPTCAASTAYLRPWARRAVTRSRRRCARARTRLRRDAARRARLPQRWLGSPWQQTTL